MTCNKRIFDRIAACISLLRPHQWLKNLMLYFPPFLGGKILLLPFSISSLIPFPSFCMASSAAYICNDIFDRHNDLHHPEKCFRPIASGRVTVHHATLLALLLFAVSIVMAMAVSQKFLLYLLAYSVISFCYSLFLKDVMVLDILAISSGFLIRLMAGGDAFSIDISKWLFWTVFLLAFFLSSGKRLGEKFSLGKNSDSHRKVLSKYPQGFLEGMLYVSGAAVLLTYTMYVFVHNSQLLFYTVPLCCFGLLRYIVRIKSGRGGDPTDSLTKDIPLFITGFLWACMVGWGIYSR